MPSVKMLSPNTTIWWVPTSGFDDVDEPTAAEVNAGVNISCAIVTGYTLNATDSDTDDSASICDNANVDTPTVDNYEADLTFFKDADTSNAASVFNVAYNLYRQVDATGYLVRRLGKASTSTAAAGDVVSIFRVSSDFMRSIDGDEGGAPIQFQVPFLPDGYMNLNVELD